jgi:hypothetical protein
MEPNLIQSAQQLPTSPKKINWSRIFLVLFVALLSGAIFGTIGYIAGKGSGQLNKSQFTDQIMQKGNLTPSAKPIEVPKSKILGLYEFSDSVIYVTDKPSYTNFYSWINPQFKTTSYGNGKRTEQIISPVSKGEGYQIVVYEQNPTDGTKSAEYIFSGKKTIIEDLRCPTQAIYDNNKVISAECKGTSECVKDYDFITNNCPLTESIAATPSAEPSTTVAPL